MGSIADALALRPDGANRWLAFADPDHESITAMFGGWTAGVALGSVVRSATGGATPSALTSALGVLTNRRDTDGHAQFSMPTVPDPETLEEFHAPGPQTMVRRIAGDYASGDSSSTHWMRDMSGRALDHVLLAYLADQNAPRSFFWGTGPRPSATLTLSVYFHATDDEIAAAGNDYVLAETTGTRGHRSTSDQHVRIWSRRGALLATSEQLCWYR